MGVIDSFVNGMNSAYSYLSSAVPPRIFLGIRLFFFAILIAIVAYIIWKFYKTLSKRNFIVLDLRRYNTSEHPVARKFLAILFYFIEYLLIMPVLILLWFVVLSAILLLIASEREIGQVLMLSGAMVMAIRILAYYSEEISKDLSKLFPFIALSVFLLTPGAFDLLSVLDKFKELPALLGSAFFFFLLIVILEIILRVVYTLTELAKGKEEVGDEDEEED